MIFCAADPMEEDAEEPKEAEEVKAMEVDELEERDQMGSAFFFYPLGQPVLNSLEMIYQYFVQWNPITTAGGGWQCCKQLPQRVPP